MTNVSKETYINTLIALSRKFCGASELGMDPVKVSREMESIEEDLNEIFGMDWDEIDAIEIAAFQ